MKLHDKVSSTTINQSISAYELLFAVETDVNITVVTFEQPADVHVDNVTTPTPGIKCQENVTNIYTTSTPGSETGNMTVNGTNQQKETDLAGRSILCNETEDANNTTTFNDRTELSDMTQIMNLSTAGLNDVWRIRLPYSSPNSTNSYVPTEQILKLYGLGYGSLIELTLAYASNSITVWLNQSTTVGNHGTRSSLVVGRPERLTVLEDEVYIHIEAAQGLQMEEIYIMYQGIR